jgi:hypothetical protein
VGSDFYKGRQRGHFLLRWESILSLLVGHEQQSVLRPARTLRLRLFSCTDVTRSTELERWLQPSVHIPVGLSVFGKWTIFAHRTCASSDMELSTAKHRAVTLMNHSLSILAILLSRALREANNVLAKIGINILITTCFMASAMASEPIQQGEIPVLIKPECKSMFFGPDFVRKDGTVKKRKLPRYVLWDPTKATPMAYKDSRTSISFYVESNGRRLAAIDPNGKLLWVRNPYEDSRFCQYRTPRPVIHFMEAMEIPEKLAELLQQRGIDTSHKFLSIKFDSSQFGVLDEVTGDFFPMGQN